MSDTETEEKEADEKEQSLYEKVVEVTGIEYDEEEHKTVDDFKQQVVRHFADMEDEEFEKLPEEVQDWVDSATEVVKKNKSARRKADLPSMAGLAEPKADKAEKGRRGRAAKGEKKERKAREKKEKLPREGRNPENNRYFRVAEFMIPDHDVDADKLREKLAKAGHEYSEITIGRAMEAFKAVYGALKKHDMIAS